MQSSAGMQTYCSDAATEGPFLVPAASKCSGTGVSTVNPPSLAPPNPARLCVCVRNSFVHAWFASRVLTQPLLWLIDAGMVCVTVRPKDATADDDGPISNARSAWSLSEHARRIDSFKRLLGRSDSTVEPAGWDLKDGSQAVEGVPLRADDYPAGDDQQHMAGGHIQLQLVHPVQAMQQDIQQQQQQQAGAGGMPVQHQQQDIYEQEVVLPGPHSATYVSGAAAGVHHRHLGLLPADDRSSIQHTDADARQHGEQQHEQEQGHQLSHHRQSIHPS